MSFIQLSCSFVLDAKADRYVTGALVKSLICKMCLDIQLSRHAQKHFKKLHCSASSIVKLKTAINLEFQLEIEYGEIGRAELVRPLRP